jgi:hypothetical protein
MEDLSFNPHDPWFDVPGAPGVQFAIQVFTLSNVYGLDPAMTNLSGTNDRVDLKCDQFSWGGQQFRSPGSVSAIVSQDESGATCWDISAKHSEPIKVIKLLLRGLPAEALQEGFWLATSEKSEVHIPSPGKPFRTLYPHGFQSVTPWIAAGRDGAGFSVSVRNTALRPVRFFAVNQPYFDQEVVLEVIMEQDAQHFGPEFAAPEIRFKLAITAGALAADFHEHMAHQEKTFDIPIWESRTDVPEWGRDIKLVLNLHGQHWTGHVFNTFDAMADALSFVTQHIPGKHILAYLAGWEGRYYYQYPVYGPGKDMGGEEGFRRLCARAKQLGVKLMPMFGANGVNAQFYPEWRRSHFRDRTGRREIMINMPDWDGDREGDDDQLFMNPGEPRWRTYLLDQIMRTVELYDFDVVYLDTTAAWFNDPNWSVIEGYELIKRELHTRFPHLMLVGEGFFDVMWKIFPFNQTWLGLGKAFRFPDVVSRYGRAIPYLAVGTPGQGSCGVHEWGWRPGDLPPPAEGHVTAIGIVTNTIKDHGPEVARRCREAMTRT